MNKAFIIVLCVLTFVSCNEIKEEDNIPTSKIEVLTSLEETEDSAKTLEPGAPATETVQPAVASKPVLIARGFEPGWYAEFANNHLRLLINNGEDSLHLDHDFTSIATDKTYKAAIVEKSNRANVTIAITVENKTCAESATGEKRDRQITIKYKNTLYKGCAYLNK